MRFVILLILACSAALAAPARAQLGPALEPGVRIRIKPVNSLGSFVGTLVSLNRDTILIRRGAGPAAMPVAMINLDWIDVSQGKRRHAAKGAFLGAVLGGLGALGYNAFKRAGCAEACSDKTLSAAVFAMGGVISGGAIGFLIRTDRWQRMTLIRDQQPLPGAKRNPPRRADFSRF